MQYEFYATEAENFCDDLTGRPQSYLCHDTFNKGLLLLHLTAKIKVAQSEWRPLFIIKACQIVDNLVS